MRGALAFVKPLAAAAAAAAVVDVGSQVKGVARKREGEKKRGKRKRPLDLHVFKTKR